MDVSPHVELVLGPMYSGKTSELMRRVRRYTHATKRCLLIKYAHDSRYSDECMASHDKQLMLAVPATKLSDVSSLVDNYDVIAIDEGQFFPDLVEFSEAAANASKVVIIAALDGDFRRKPFGRVLELIPMAERVDKLTAVCTSCYRDACFTKRTVASTEIELIGGAESYQPVCRTCYREANVAAAAAAAAANVNDMEMEDVVVSAPAVNIPSTPAISSKSASITPFVQKTVHAGSPQ